VAVKSSAKRHLFPVVDIHFTFGCEKHHIRILQTPLLDNRGTAQSIFAEIAFLALSKQMRERTECYFLEVQ